LAVWFTDAASRSPTGPPGWRALATLWPDVPTQRCAVRKHRNLLARAPDALHGAVSAGHIDVIDATTPKEGEAKR
jgi:putative transposase